MPRFFMNIRNGRGLAIDFEGTECADLGQAKREALLDARELTADRVRSGDLVEDDCLEIADEGGNVVAMITFRDAIRFY